MLSHAGHEQPPHGLGRRHGPILALFHDEEVRAALYPMCVRYKPHGEKTGKTASQKHQISGKQKKNTRPTAQMEAK